ncbi:hypothetical protein HDU98_009075 [Podochytrium sp. JEL0797]|nr:hypothetical protein HDU98_009075 [Podochytrium sp. JEL0797]
MQMTATQAGRETLTEDDHTLLKDHLHNFAATHDGLTNTEVNGLFTLLIMVPQALRKTNKQHKKSQL